MNLDGRGALPKASTPKIETSTKMHPRRKAKAKGQRRKSLRYKMKKMKLYDAYVVTTKRKKTRREI